MRAALTWPRGGHDFATTLTAAGVRASRSRATSSGLRYGGPGAPLVTFAAVGKKDDKAVRIVVGRSEEPVSDVWRFWRGSPDASLYAAMRNVGGQMKFSFHPHGERPYRYAFTSEYVRDNPAAVRMPPGKKSVDAWMPPEAERDGHRLLLVVVMPQSELDSTGGKELDDDKKTILSYPAPLEGQVASFALYISPPNSGIEDHVGFAPAAQITDVLGGQVASIVAFTRPEASDDRAYIEHLRKSFIVAGRADLQVTFSAIGVREHVSGSRWFYSVRVPIHGSGDSGDGYRVTYR